MGAQISTPVRRDGRGGVWVSPILDWSAGDCSAYMEQHGLARNPVVDKLHRSGECLCGALARREELEWIAFWYPETAAYIRSLEKRCFDAGLPCRWGGEKGARKSAQQAWLPLCQGCASRWDELEPSLESGHAGAPE